MLQIAQLGARLATRDDGARSPVRQGERVRCRRSRPVRYRPDLHRGTRRRRQRRMTSPPRCAHPEASEEERVTSAAGGGTRAEWSDRAARPRWSSPTPTCAGRCFPSCTRCRTSSATSTRARSPLVAQELNISRADVHGVVTFYSDFRRPRRRRCDVRVCRAEACQSVGGRALAAHATRAPRRRLRRHDRRRRGHARPGLLPRQLRARPVGRGRRPAVRPRRRRPARRAGRDRARAGGDDRRP